MSPRQEGLWPLYISSNVHSSQTRSPAFCKTGGMTPDSIARTLDEFLAGSSTAVVIEDGAVLFDLAQAKYWISGENNKCLLHLWSPERNVVRRVLDVESKGETLLITVQRMGQPRPTKLEICRERDRRTSSAKRKSRMLYQRILERTLKRRFS